MILEIALYVVFFVAALALIVIVLVQEGKGGGLTDAFGGAGVEAFGVRPGGINRFTLGLFAVFILSALGIHWANLDPNKGSVMQDVAPPDAGAAVIPGLPQTPPPAPPAGDGN